MKFSAGYWQMREGVEPHYAVQVIDTKVEADRLTVSAPTRRIQHRGDTLNIALMTVEYSSPMNNVIRVRAYHHAGGVDTGVHFELFEEANRADRGVDIPSPDGTLAARFGVKRDGSHITVSVIEGQATNWSVELHDNKEVVQVDGGVIASDGSVIHAKDGQLIFELAEG